jgi:DNA repair protein RecO (recombination protein O)
MLGRERSFRVEAIILRHIDWGEADRILTIFSQEMGKLRALAKGVRKLRSRKAGHLEPFTRVSLQLARARDLPIITQAETLDAYMPLREDLLMPTYAALVVELLDRFTYEEGENRGLYRSLANTLSRLSAGHNPDLVIQFYELHLLDLVGFRPHLFHCANCGREILAQDQFFSPEHGGVLCPDCGKGNPAARPVSMNALKYMRHFQRSSYSQASKALITAAVYREIENLMQDYITYYLERGLNTPSFLRRARSAGQVQNSDGTVR